MRRYRVAGYGTTDYQCQTCGEIMGHQEALAAGDYHQADLCAIALAPHESADSQGGDLVGPDGQPWTRTEAREECARVIADAVAADDQQEVSR